MKKSMIYTRTGDAGTTALVGGSRIAKNSIRVSAYGDLDELNSHLGLVQAYAAQMPEAADEAAMLLRIELTLFGIGATLATPGTSTCKALEGDAVKELEESIDLIDSLVEPQKWFILPGGCVAAAEAHVARTVCRRAERSILTLADAEPVDPTILTYMNRLSDWLYILARRLNALSGVAELKV
ncbi:MAG: cob(I)yrinic acid a,c-diamide adenosyltransferase [Muribaculaceae bacterium]|nr:cob(I)yrinic acid a,c-diamide adenosyltransferase [Muribaculaceae bacterium]